MLNPIVSSTALRHMTLQQVHLAVFQLLQERSLHHYRLGELYNHVVSAKLAQKTKSKSASGYFLTHFPQLSSSTLAACGSLAREFSEAAYLRCGSTRLGLLLTYAHAAGISVDPDEPELTFIRLPAQNGAFVDRLFSECSVAELRQALQRLRKPRSIKPLSTQEGLLMEKYRRSITAWFTPGTRIRVQVDKHRGQVVLHLKNLPLAHAERLSQALQR